MAGNNSLQILRGDYSKISKSTATLLDGQPLYDRTNNLLYIGSNDEAAIKDLTPVNGTKLVTKEGAPVVQLDQENNIIENYANAVKVVNNDRNAYVELSVDDVPCLRVGSDVELTLPEESGQIALVQDVTTLSLKDGVLILENIRRKE